MINLDNVSTMANENTKLKEHNTIIEKEKMKYRMKANFNRN